MARGLKPTYWAIQGTKPLGFSADADALRKQYPGATEYLTTSEMLKKYGINGAQAKARLAVPV